MGDRTKRVRWKLKRRRTPGPTGISRVTGRPTRKPTRKPTARPTARPTAKPKKRPTRSRTSPKTKTRRTRRPSRQGRLPACSIRCFSAISPTIAGAWPEASAEAAL
ncbi:hypothetical protein C0Z16_30135 [Paraburkholderia rhynchosiae]|uniref:Uncharacterized protein n=1 Tax=Paraburkholderia rhynchosiae TaxID=487049 RepID=A0ABX4UXL6_9BURK|nr:hypothetical protein C0Z16_30135 [Paraburkholderia rhynchosiae]